MSGNYVRYCCILIKNNLLSLVQYLYKSFSNIYNNLANIVTIIHSFINSKFSIHSPSLSILLPVEVLFRTTRNRIHCSMRYDQKIQHSSNHNFRSNILLTLYSCSSIRCFFLSITSLLNMFPLYTQQIPYCSTENLHKFCP